MDLRDQFWRSIEQDMVKDFGNGHPSDWQKPEIEAFLFRMNDKLQDLCREDEEKARFCNVPTYRGDFEYHRLQPLSYDAFRKIFKVKESKGGKSTRNQFAIYFGADSYEDYLLKNKISTPEPAELSDAGNQNLGPIGAKEKPTRPAFLWRWGTLLLLLLSFVICNRFYPEKNDCVLEAVGDDQFILVTTDAGLNYINPSSGENKVLASGPHFTGFAYDQEDNLVFWSNTNHNYRSIGRADLSSGFQDENLNHRFIKDLPYPLGIALDQDRDILYLADYGELGRLNDGTIRAYDYDGKLLHVIYQDSIDPSSIILDEMTQILYWTDPQKQRIGRFDLRKEICEPNWLDGVGLNPDGMVLDQSISRLYWASNRDSLIGWVNLYDEPDRPQLRKIGETATALAINPVTGHLLYSSYDQEKIKWLKIRGDSIQKSYCGQSGIQTDASSPRVLKLVTR